MLSKLTIAAAIVTLTGYSTDASAAVPSFSGTYLFQSEETCPATLIVTQNKTGDITNIVTGTAGDLNIDNFAVTLTPAAGKPNNGKSSAKATRLRSAVCCAAQAKHSAMIPKPSRLSEPILIPQHRSL